jgi:hypothetical protein
MLVGEPKLEDADPHTPHVEGGPIDYAAIILCKIKSGGRLKQ